MRGKFLSVALGTIRAVLIRYYATEDMPCQVPGLATRDTISGVPPSRLSGGLPIEPRLKKSFMPPGGSAGNSRLVNGMTFEIAGEGGQFESILIKGRLSYNIIEPLRALEPPMAEQFGIEGCDDDRQGMH